MQLSIRSKAIYFVIGSLVIVLGSISFINYQSQKISLESLYESNAETLQFALSKNIESLMRNGENDQLQPLLEEFHEKKLVEEISIINAEQLVSRSTNTTLLQKISDDPQWSKLFQAGKDITLKKEINGEPVLVTYKAYVNGGSCTECHDINTEKNLGGLKIVKSELEMVNTIAANSKNIILLGIIGTILIIVGILLFLNKTIFKPINEVQDKLQKAASGDVNQLIEVKSQNEIGTLLQSIKNLILYMKDLSEIADSIAQNDLSISVKPKSDQDALGYSFASMVNNLSDIIQQINASSTEVASAATQISASSEQVAKNAQNQEIQISQITAAIEEMAATIIESSQNAADASNGAQSATDTAGAGGQVVSETIEGMNRIAQVVQESSKNIHKLANSAEQISEIISLIDDIADQTNLLALNAAIEAARAGEQGRGFAVVADEVRKLAERTGKATGEITKMIKDIQKGTEEAVSSMEEGNQEVNNGKELADKAGNSLTEVVQQSQNVMNMILQIATATEEQSVAAEEISKNIEMVTIGTRESATGAEQASTAAAQLSCSAENLQTIVGKFKLK